MMMVMMAKQLKVKWIKKIYQIKNTPTSDNYSRIIIIIAIWMDFEINYYKWMNNGNRKLFNLVKKTHQCTDTDTR